MEAEAKMAAVHGWSSLPEDLVNRVADCLLATNDLDCYTDLRAVCHHWRSVTADPASNPQDPRFRPTQWIMLGEIEYYARRDDDDDDSPLLLVNTATGRFVSRRLPFLRGYHLATTSTGGFLVLEEAAGPPWAARFVNPFTGCTIRFKACLPSEESLTADVVFTSERPTLVVAARTRTSSSDSFSFYLADPDSKSFAAVKMPSRSLSSRCASRFLETGTAWSPLLLLPFFPVEVAPGEILLVVYSRQRCMEGVRGVFRITLRGG